MKRRLKAGVSLVDISPGLGIELAGYPHHPRHNAGVHDPLYAGCILLDDGETRLAIVCADILMISKTEIRTIREEAASLAPVPAGNILIACSHTHSGPWASGRLDLEALEKRLEPDAAYLAALRSKLAGLVKSAYEGRFDAEAGVDKGFCGREQGVGGNRRNPNEIADPEVWVVGVKDSAGNLRGAIVKYALHPTFLHSNNLQVSADYPGAIRSFLQRKEPGLGFLFAQGTSGNQSPRYFRTDKTYSEAVRVGSAIGEETARVLNTMSYSSDALLLVRSSETDLELRTLPPRAEAERLVTATRANWERIKATSSVEREIWEAELQVLGAEDTLGYITIMERGEKLPLLHDELPAEVQVIGIGDARIVGLPGEVFVEFGIAIQYRAPFDRTFVIELANGCLPGYACTPRAYAQGGYEAGTSLLTGRAGEQLVETAVKLLWETKEGGIQ